MSKYSAADFANARFAEHPDGDFAARLYPEHVDPWFGEDDCAYTDQVLADTGWVPVPTKPTITQSELTVAEGKLAAACSTEQAEDFLLALGIAVIPDPEPTNTERLANILVESFNSMEFDLEDSFREIATVLDKNGVTAPNVKGN